MKIFPIRAWKLRNGRRTRRRTQKQTYKTARGSSRSKKMKYFTHDKEQLDANMELFQLLLLFFGNFWVSRFFGPDTIKHVIHEVSKKSKVYNLKKYNENYM